MMPAPFAKNLFEAGEGRSRTGVAQINWFADVRHVTDESGRVVGNLELIAKS